MARLSKVCPKCQQKRELEMRFVPTDITRPGAKAAFTLTCKTCHYTLTPEEAAAPIAPPVTRP